MLVINAHAKRTMDLMFSNDVDIIVCIVLAYLLRSTDEFQKNENKNDHLALKASRKMKLYKFSFDLSELGEQRDNKNRYLISLNFERARERERKRNTFLSIEM